MKEEDAREKVGSENFGSFPKNYYQMTYKPDRFLSTTPVFRRGEMLLDLQLSLRLDDRTAERELQSTLSDLTDSKCIRSIRKGLYVKDDLLSAPPDWLMYAIASKIAPDAVLGMQAALWFHLGHPPPRKLHVFTMSAGEEFVLKQLPGTRVLPVESRRAPGSDEFAVDPIDRIRMERHLGCPVPIRVTVLERTLVDILDGLRRRPRASRVTDLRSVQDATRGSIEASDSLDEPSALEEFLQCWDELSRLDGPLDFSHIKERLEDRPLSTRAKVGFFLSLFQTRLGITDADLNTLLRLPQAPHDWFNGVSGKLIRRWNLVVPDQLLHGSLLKHGEDQDQPQPRLREGRSVLGLDLESELRHRFGGYQIQSFKEGQRPLIEAVLKGKDALGILPTGGGKSLTYQFTSTLLNGPTLVVSPLISLMEDQVREARGLGLNAFRLKGKTSSAELLEVAEALDRGVLNLLFVSPESWETVLSRISGLRNKTLLVVIDESHLVEEWGREFRASYRTLGKLISQLKRASILALTATATRQGREFITRSLGLEADAIVTKLPLYRPNLYLRRQEVPGDGQSKLKTLLEFLNTKQGQQGLIYCSTKREVDFVVKAIRDELQKDVTPYHSGIDDAVRSSIMRSFSSGECKVVVATSAFGLGVNKREVRFVVHFGAPSRMEDYVQEIGRAGRDGVWSECLVIHSAVDWVKWEKRLVSKSKFKNLVGQAADQVRLSENIAMDKQALRMMKRFISETGCLHRFIEEYFFDPQLDTRILQACKTSCDSCITPIDHRAKVLRGVEEDLRAAQSLSEFGLSDT